MGSAIAQARSLEKVGPLEIDVSGLSARVADTALEPLIDELELHAAAGDIHAILGPTAAGKTTLLRILAGLERRFEGTVLIGKRPVSGPNRRVQLMFQDHRLLPWFDVFENVSFGLHEPDPDLVDHWLGVVELSDRKTAWPRTLSGGESSRVSLARAFVSRPSVLLLDEPFHALDVIVRAELCERLMAALARSPATVLMVSHAVEDALMLADVVHIVRARPMRISRTLRVDLPRPRRRQDAGLLRRAADVYAALEETRRP